MTIESALRQFDESGTCLVALKAHLPIDGAQIGRCGADRRDHGIVVSEGNPFSVARPLVGMGATTQGTGSERRADIPRVESGHFPGEVDGNDRSGPPGGSA